MDPQVSKVAREAKAMTRREVIQKAIEGRIKWIHAADILGITPRHILRLREQYLKFGVLGDRRNGKRQPRRIPEEVVSELLRLKREVYPDFTIRHFHQFATEKHEIHISYTCTRNVLQAHGLVEKAPGRGKYRRKRERRPMVGMLLHMDGSTHRWLPELPMQDLIVMLDDADGRILYARFVEQEGTVSTFAALRHVVGLYGRFGELYTDRGSHFCRTERAGAGPAAEQNGQVARALRTLGIRQVLARSPEARGRSERAFGTIQGRLPQELRVAGVTNYEAANVYLDQSFVPDFNRRFTVTPAERESAFMPVAGIDLDLVLSVHHERIVRNDSTVIFENLFLQLPPTSSRAHYVRCPVTVHEFVTGKLGVSYQGRLVARFTPRGELLAEKSAPKGKAA